MDPPTSRLEAVCTAVASTSTCTAAAVATLKDLLLCSEHGTPEAASKVQGQISKGGRARAQTTSGSTKTGSSKLKTRGEGGNRLTEKERVGLATNVLNASLRSLSDAVKNQSQKQSASNAEKPSPRRAPRRSNSTPLSPLQSRTLNKVHTCPTTAPKLGRTVGQQAGTTGCLATIECVRLAFAALEALQDGGKGTLPELELETARSSLVGKLVALGMLDQAAIDLRVLKQRLDGPSSAPRAKASTKTNGPDPSSSGRGFSSLLDFPEVKASGKRLGLVIASQIHALRILAGWKKPQSIEAAVPYLRGSYVSSPLKLLRQYSNGSQADAQKAARQMETLSTLLASLCPKTGTQDDDSALEARLNITPAAALVLQEAALEARICWWDLAGHRGNVDNDILLPLSKYIRAFIRRSREEAPSSYRTCEGTFQRIYAKAMAGERRPSLSSRSPLSAIYSCLGNLARQSTQVDKAISWFVEVRNLSDPAVDTAARCCSTLAELLSLHLADSSRLSTVGSLLTELLEAIRTPLRGDTTELDEVLRTLGLVRKAAMRCWLAQSKDDASSQPRIPDSVKHLLETFLCQYPKFCFRWLGKPPASKSSTKDFVRYEQRRQLLTTSIGSIIDSALLITKALVEEKRAEWETVDSVLADCLTLLEYIEHTSSDTSTSYCVKISNFYYMMYRELRLHPDGSKNSTAFKAICQSVDCIKYRSKEEKEKGHLITKLEQKAEVCKALGRGGDALLALQTIRGCLVDDGGLDAVTKALDSQHPHLAWTSTPKTTALSRNLISIAKLEQVCIDWTVDMSELEQAAVLEHRLCFILLEQTGSREDVTLSHPCVDSLLRIYYPTRFPVRRVRTLLRLLSISIDKPDVLADIRPQVQAAIGLLDGYDLGDDTCLSSYVPYYQSLYTSLSTLIEGTTQSEILGRLLATWDGLLIVDASTATIDQRIDNLTDFLSHLQSVVDFVRTTGHDGIVTATLEFMAKLGRTSSQTEQNVVLAYDTQLAMQYTAAGDFPRAEEILKKSQLYVQEKAAVSSDTSAKFHLAFAEYFIATGVFDKADLHLKEARATEGDFVPTTRSAKASRDSIIAHASLLQSIVALEKGDAQHALFYSGNCAGVLFHKWQKLEAATASRACRENEASLVANNMSLMADVSAEKQTAADASSPGATASPQFWSLLHPLFRSQIRLSSVYAHLGMFRETMFFAEQARKVASGANATMYLTQSEAWISTIWLRASKPDKSIELLDPIREKMQVGIGGCLSATLACELSAIYGQLKDDEAATEMIARAEALITMVSANGKETSQANSASGETLEKDMSKLSLNEKSTAKGRKPRVPATRKVSRQASTAKAAVKATKPSTPDAITCQKRSPASHLVLALRGQKISQLLDKHEWGAALALLREAQEIPKSASALLAERVGLALCILGQSSEQMTKDAVFSVIKDSTLAFPSVCGSSAGGDRLSLSRSTTTCPEKAGTSAAARDASKERRLGAFIDDLVEARGYLTEAHSMATTMADGGLLHRISALLQSCAILLSAASSAKPRLIGHPGYATCSVEMARNLTWRGERNTLHVEKSWQKSKGLDWPADLPVADSRRSSLGHAIDINRFQSDYIDIIPKEWTVVSISLSDSKGDFCITKLQAGHSPFVIRLPLDRAGSDDADEGRFGFQEARAELLEIIEQANVSCHNGREATTKEAQSEWWAGREALDGRMEKLLARIENVWLGGFRGMFSCHRRRTELLARFQKSFQNVLDKHLPSRRQVHRKRTKAAPVTTPTKVTLDPRILELFVGLGDATVPGCDFDDALDDLLYFVVDILQFHGERNAYDEIDFDSMVVEVFDALHSYHTAAKRAPQVDETSHTILVLDKALHTFPWESLPCLQDLAVSRVPSLACLRRLLADLGDDTSSHNGKQEASGSRPSGHRVPITSGTYILNPSTDLKTTQTTFYKPLMSLGASWTRIVSRAPSEAEFEAALTQRDVLLYFGHGSGAQYIRGRRVRRLPRCRAVALLMGCSSGSLTYNGEFEVHGPVWDYMLAGCPAVVGTLWDVTDRDVDRYAGRVLEEWGLLPRGTFDDKAPAGKGKGKTKTGSKERGKKVLESGDAGEYDEGRTEQVETSLVEAVARARTAPRFRYLTAAAVVVYGIPTYLSK